MNEEKEDEFVIHAPRALVFRYYTDYANLPKISKYIKSASIVNSSGSTVVVDFEVQAGTTEGADHQQQLRQGRHKFVLYPPERVDEQVLTGGRAGARTVTHFEEVNDRTTRILTESTAPPERERSSGVPVNTAVAKKRRARAMLSEEFEHRKRILEALASRRPAIP